LPIDRDRERAKRRYARRQATQAARRANRRRTLQILGAVVIVVLLVAGIYGLSRMFGRAQTGGAGTSGAAARDAGVHSSQMLITYGDLRPSADLGSRSANGTVTKGFDIRTLIPQGGTANGSSRGAAAHHLIESSTVNPR
jgi:hypothetical protein